MFLCVCSCNLTNQLLLQLLAQLDKLQQLMSDLKYSNDGDTSQSDVGQAVLNTELVLKMHLEKVFVVDRCPQRVLKVITGKSLGFSMSCRCVPRLQHVLQVRASASACPAGACLIAFSEGTVHHCSPVHA